MRECYLCGNAFNDLTTKKHDEHIIQQAIGGSLTANDILCANCGGILGKDIDIPFNKTFTEISTLLDIKTDRGSNKTPRIKAKYKEGYDQHGIYLEEMDVTWHKGKVSPCKPFHRYACNNEIVIIYAHTETAKKYKEKVLREIEQNFSKDSAPEVIICDNLEGAIEYPLNIENESFKKGLAKIAIGFALKSGLKRESIPMILFVDKKTNEASIQEKVPLVQFYPLSPIESVIEEDRRQLEHYPMHTLILFNTPTKPSTLVCYIELFSTFQWYVLLNINYQGPCLYESYAQNILKRDDEVFSPGRRYHKERSLYLESLGINDDRIQKKLAEYGGKKTKQQVEHEIIQEEQNKQKYKIDFEEHLQNIVSYSIRRRKASAKDIQDKQELLMNAKLFFSSDEDGEEVFCVSNYRRIYYKRETLMDYLSELAGCYHLLKSRGHLKEYGHKKVRDLFIYIQTKRNKSDI